ncbi:MAG: hypothetical protein KC496_02620, partial [Anaerolineae bacterium]|nr:hypothetical protein [Anaerolineae bacterium]
MGRFQTKNTNIPTRGITPKTGNTNVRSQQVKQCFFSGQCFAPTICKRKSASNPPPMKCMNRFSGVFFVSFASLSFKSFCCICAAMHNRTFDTRTNVHYTQNKYSLKEYETETHCVWRKKMGDLKDFKKLSERQQNILQFMVGYMNDNGFPPTIREIGE